MKIVPMSRTELFEGLRGQTIRVKGLESAFSSWPCKVNPHVDQLRQDVTNHLDE